MSKIAQSFPPIAQSSFTIINQGSKTITDAFNSINIISPSQSSAHNTCLLVKSVVAPYSVTVNLRRFDFNSGWSDIGVGWRESSSGKLVAVRHTSSGGSSGIISCSNILVSKFSNPATWITNYYTSNATFWDTRWYRMVEDNTNRILYASNDGINWISVFSVGRTDYLTADQCGIIADTYNASTTFSVYSCNVDYSG